MAEFDARIKLKRDTSSNWTTNNPVLLNGERIIVDTDAGEVRYKTGDGVKTYIQLPFDDEAVRNLVDSKHRELQEQINNLATNGGAVQSDWNESNPDSAKYILNRPFYDSRVWHTYVFDGILDGRDILMEGVQSNGTKYWVKVAEFDHMPTSAEISAGTLSLGTVSNPKFQVSTVGNRHVFTEDGHAVYSMSAYLIAENSIDLGFGEMSSGVWFVYLEGSTSSIFTTELQYLQEDNAHKLVLLDEMYIPTSIARSDDVNVAFETAVQHTDELIATHQHNWNDLQGLPVDETFISTYDETLVSSSTATQNVTLSPPIGYHDENRQTLTHEKSVVEIHFNGTLIATLCDENGTFQLSPTNGTYTYNGSSYSYALMLDRTTGLRKIKVALPPLDEDTVVRVTYKYPKYTFKEEYIPNTIARVADIEAMIPDNDVSDEEFIDTLVGLGLIDPPAVDLNGAFYTDANGVILTL